MNTRFSTNRAAEERALFEQAKAKLEEAFVLMRSLEGRLDAWDAMRGRGPLDDAKRAEEQAELLAYVEEAQREALRMARRSRRLSRVRVRAKTPATVERADATIDDLPSAFDDIDETDDRSPTSNKHAAAKIDPIERADMVERLLDEVAKVVAVVPSPVSAVDGRGPFALAYPPPADGLTEGGAARLATHAAAIYALAAERMEKGIAVSPDEPSLETDTIAMKLVAMEDYFEVTDVSEDISDDISDEELEAFSAALVANAATAAQKWWPASSQSGESEKAGARMRRDRSPTEIMDRPPLTRLQRVKRFLTARTAVVVVASAVLGTLVGLTLRAVSAGDDVTTPTETLRLPFVGPPSELAQPSQSEFVAPTETTEVHTRTMREAKPASSAPAIKAPPRCATAKCRASSSGQAKKTKTAATAAAKVESKSALSSGLTGSLARRATTSATPTTVASKSVVIAQGRSF